MHQQLAVLQAGLPADLVLGDDPVGDAVSGTVGFGCFKERLAFWCRSIAVRLDLVESHLARPKLHLEVGKMVARYGFHEEVQGCCFGGESPDIDIDLENVKR